MPPGRPPGGRSRFLTEEEQAHPPKITSELLKRVFSYLKPYWKQFIVVLLCIIAASVFSLMPSILTGRIIDVGIVGRDLNALIYYIVLSFAVTLISNLIGVLQSYCSTWTAQHISFDMRNALYEHLQKMSQRFFTTSNQGDIITRMTSDIDGVQRTIADTFSNILSNAITLIVAVIAMYQKDWILATIGLVIVPLFAFPTRRAGKTRWSITRDAQACNDEVNQILNETLSVSGQLLMKLFCKEEYEAAKYRSANEKMIGLNIRESMAGRWFRVVISTVTSIGPMLIYLVGGILIMKYNSDLTIGDITVLVTLLGRMYQPVNSLLNVQVDWIRSMAMFTRLFEYFDMPVEIDNAPDAVIPEVSDGSVSFENVQFGYDSSKQILKDVSFDLACGKSIAIVGPSGAGKSTIANLIPRFYDVDSGCVKFSGTDVRKLDLKFLRQSIGVVSQETYLFNGSIRDNLLYAKPDATEEELEDVCRKANIYDFICSLDERFDTQVGNRGLKLSGGEKQRISIARVLLKDPDLLIFDEATASLDSISESRIQEAIDPIIKTRTSILIAHRLSTILAADEILVVKDGRIVERGQHADLVALDGVYNELYRTQFKRAEELEAESQPDIT